MCGKHAVGPNHLSTMAEVGADVMVCLCEEPELAERYPDYVAWLKAESPGGRAIWFPIPDLHAPTLEQVRPLLDRLAASLHAGDVLLMHCGAGIGRTGTVAAALLIDVGVSHPEALSAVARARPMAGPEVGAQSRLLEDLARERGR